MSRSNVFQVLLRLAALSGTLLVGGPLLLTSCRQDDPNRERKEYIEVYSSPEALQDGEDPVTELSVTVMGGTAVIPVKSNVEFTASWQDQFTTPWAKVSDVRKTGDNQYEVVLSFAKRYSFGYYTRRYGMLMLTAPSLDLGSFVTVNQGLVPRLSCDFSWSKYGTSDPRKLDGVPYSGWTTYDKSRGWVPEDAEDSKVYGKNGFIMLGDENGTEAMIQSPYAEEIRSDSLAVVSFRAVAYTDVDGVKDCNKFTVEITGGGVFRDNGETVMSFEAPYADPASEGYPGNYWDGSEYLLGIISTAQSPFTSDTRIVIRTGGTAAAGKPSRLLVDNFYIRRIVESAGDEDLYLANGGSGKDNLLGAPSTGESETE